MIQIIALDPGTGSRRARDRGVHARRDRRRRRAGGVRVPVALGRAERRSPSPPAGSRCRATWSRSTIGRPTTRSSPSPRSRVRGRARPPAERDRQLLLGEESRVYPGPVSQFFYPFPGARRASEHRLPFLDRPVPFAVDPGAEDVGEGLVDRESRILEPYGALDEEVAHDAWRRYFRQIYRDNYMRLAPVAEEVERSSRPSASPASTTRTRSSPGSRASTTSAPAASRTSSRRSPASRTRAATATASR